MRADGDGSDNPTPDIFHLPELPTPPKPAPSGRSAVAATAEDPAIARIGLAMHRLLEWGGALTAEHIGAVAREFRLNPAQAADAAALVNSILRGAGAWAWRADALDWQGNEVDLVYRGRPLRLDRLVRRRDAGHEGQWWVLDYKTAPAPELQPALIAQLRHYRAAVRLIYPGTVVRAAFLTGMGTMVELE